MSYCGISIPDDIQGKSFKPIVEGNKPEDWLDCVYYRYWTARGEHGVSPHYGIRTPDYKLICYLDKARDYSGNALPELENCTWPQWELFDLTKDQEELHNVYDNPSYASIVKELTDKLYELKARYEDNES